MSRDAYDDRRDNQQSRGAEGLDFHPPHLETPFLDSDQREENDDARADYDNGKYAVEGNEDDDDSKDDE
jgi:hypothetical protein